MTNLHEETWAQDKVKKKKERNQGRKLGKEQVDQTRVTEDLTKGD